MDHLPYPITQGHWLAPEVRFHTGEVMPTLRMAYTTVGHPDGEPVLVLHGTNGSAASLLTPAFAGALFGPGQPLDASSHWIILPDAIGAGESAKPSDGLRTAFPRYHYGDMVDAQHRLLTEHLGVRHLRVVIGYSMGGMHTWLWAQQHPQFMDVAVPLAAQPAAMSGRNWMLRRLLIEVIRSDPEWHGGHYTRQPRSLQWASAFYAAAANGGNQGLQKLAPSRDRADALVEQRLHTPFIGDANDHLYQWDAARDYDPTPGLARIEAAVLAINSEDDERNPPELGLLDAALKHLRHGRALVLPGSPDTAGHSTVLQAGLWTPAFAEFLAQVPRRTSPS
jgi:homoserine O-acetyltransferase/O-succinyltransferase